MIAALMSMVSACSADGDAHAVCTDEAATSAYMLAWMDDVVTAKKAGKLSVGQVVEIQGNAYEKLYLLKEGSGSDFCAHLDAIRSEGGF